MAIAERWHSLLKDRTKVMRAFRDIDTLIQFTDGFLVYYNYFNPHSTLGGETPAEAAQIEYDIKDWKDVIRIPVFKEAEIRSHILPRAKAIKTSLEGKRLFKRRRKRKTKGEADIHQSLSTVRLK